MARKKKIPEIKKEYPMLQYLRDLSLFDNPNLYEIIEQPLPNYISDSMKHDLRSYQIDAIKDLMILLNTKISLSHYSQQLLFNMATGSGKTDVMAAMILYLYHEFHYQNFLFVVNSDAIVRKTFDNLIHQSSSKYLYKDKIEIDGQEIQLKSVQTFPQNANEHTIYIRLTTIQALHNELTAIQENGLTFDALAKTPIVILADEAHHYNTKTKTKAEKLNASWEDTLDRIRQLRNDESGNKNLQLEFTATIDLNKEEIYQKYRDKLAFRYDLSRFVKDGYSKNIYRIQANNNDEYKMLDAVLLNQFRKRIAFNMDIPNFKPLILFKSGTIKASKENQEKFIDLIENLTVSELQQFLDQQLKTVKSEMMNETYHYWQNQDLAKVVAELKKDFQARNILNANDKIADKINDLESVDNPFRVIFAVNKLDEGWDVLNLYDIVRIGEQKNNKNATNSEAQLIGRGARYYPFKYQGQNAYQRRFDEKNLRSQLLERLCYHTINEPKYIENLKQSLDEMDLPVKEDDQSVIYETVVKPSFKKTDLYKKGHIYYNEVEDVELKEYASIQRYGIIPDEQTIINLIDSVTEAEFNKDEIRDIEYNFIRVGRNFYLSEDRSLLKKALARNQFFKFSNLKKYLPTLKSMDEFMTSDKWLGKAHLVAKVPPGLSHLSRMQELESVSKYLTLIQSKIVKNFKKKRGTNRFVGIPVKEVVKDYTKKVAPHFNSPQQNQLIQKYSMKNDPWFVFEYAIVNGLEYSFIQMIKGYLDQFEKSYDEVYLLRNDEKNTDVKLHDFGNDATHYEGFMPDFILYLLNEDYSYQIYVEPKGDQNLEKDRWKEELLEKIAPENVEIIGENQDVRLYGIKFYTAGDGRHIIKELQDKHILLPE